MSKRPPYRLAGMDPWLESPALWPGVHDRLIVYLADELNSQLAPAYVALPAPRTPPGHYRVVIRRASHRDRAEVYAIPLAERLPRMRIPLRTEDPDASADLQALLERVYREGRYGELINYGQPAEPPLEQADREWACAILEKCNLP